MNMYELLFESKIKGADGKACWDGYRYAGTEDGKDKCVPVKEDEYDDEEQQDEGFFIVLGSEDEGGFVGMVTKDGGKWRESAIHGNAPHNWGSTYMGYLTTDDVMQHMRNDYQRHYAVNGPFHDEQEAIEYADYQYGPGDNDFEKEGVEETMDISTEPDNESRDAVKSAICNRITRMHVPLLSKYGLDAVLQAIDDVADWVGDVDEIGSSDVSAWTKDVIQTLERQGG